MTAKGAKTTESKHAPDLVDMQSKTVTIRGFTFCVHHGLEKCEKCKAEYVESNNVEVQEEVTKPMTERERAKKWKGDKREPLNIDGKWTKGYPETIPVCVEHKITGCDECFDWVTQLQEQALGKKLKKRLAKKEAEVKDAPAAVSA